MALGHVGPSTFVEICMDCAKTALQQCSATGEWGCNGERTRESYFVPKYITQGSGQGTMFGRPLTVWGICHFW